MGLTMGGLAAAAALASVAGGAYLSPRPLSLGVKVREVARLSLLASSFNGDSPRGVMSRVMPQPKASATPAPTRPAPHDACLPDPQVAAAASGFVHGAAAFYVLAVLFGGWLWQPTNVHWAAVQALLSAVPLFLEVGTASGAQVWRRLVEPGGVSASTSASALPAASLPATCLPAGLALLGSYLGAVVVPLDWNQPWQAWPGPGIWAAAGASLAGWTLLACLRGRPGAAPPPPKRA